MVQILETLEKNVSKLMKNTSMLVAILAGTSLTSCQQTQRRPEPPYTFYEFVGRVKGENVAYKYSSSTTASSYGSQTVFSHSKGPQTYTFVLETERGFRTFSATTWEPTELEVLISPGDNLKVHYFGESSPESSQFSNDFAIKEINGKRIDTSPGVQLNASRMINSRIIKID